jgi:hypothetical protein
VIESLKEPFICGIGIGFGIGVVLVTVRIISEFVGGLIEGDKDP